MNLDLAQSGDLLQALLPELVLTGSGLVLLLVIAWRHRTAADLRLPTHAIITRAWRGSRPRVQRRGGCGGTPRARSGARE